MLGEANQPPRTQSRALGKGAAITRLVGGNYSPTACFSLRSQRSLRLHCSVQAELFPACGFGGTPERVRFRRVVSPAPAASSAAVSPRPAPSRWPLSPCRLSPAHVPRGARPASRPRATCGSPSGPAPCCPPVSSARTPGSPMAAGHAWGRRARNTHPRTPPAAAWGRRSRGGPAAEGRASNAGALPALDLRPSTLGSLLPAFQRPAQLGQQPCPTTWRRVRLSNRPIFRKLLKRLVSHYFSHVCG